MSVHEAERWSIGHQKLRGGKSGTTMVKEQNLGRQ